MKLGLLSKINKKDLINNYWNKRPKKGGELRIAPGEFLTEEICWEIIKKYAYAVQFIPKKFNTYGFYLEAAARGTSLRYIPIKFMDERLCRTAAKKNFRNLEWVPSKIRFQLQKELNIWDYYGS